MKGDSIILVMFSALLGVLMAFGAAGTLTAVVFYCNIDFTLCHAERNYVPFFQQSRKKFNKFIPHKNHLLYREVLTASGESPSLLKDIISYQRNLVNKKSQRRLSRCRSRSDPDCRAGNLPPRQSSCRRSQMESPKNRGAYLKVSM